MVQISYRKLIKNKWFKYYSKSNKGFPNKRFLFVNNFLHFHHAYILEKEYNNVQNNLYNLIFFGYGNCKHVSLIVKYIFDDHKTKL